MDNQTWDNMDILQLEGLKVTPQSAIPAFVIFLVLYIFIMVSNLGLVVLICMERSLHQPMYLLFCNMSINEAMASTVFIPAILSNVFRPMTQRFIHYYECIIQAFVGHLNGSVSHTVLVVMAFDRYVAICNPLRYATIMTTRMVVKLSVGAWLSAFVMVAILLGLSIRLRRCRWVIPHPFCDNASLFKLSCDSVLANQIYGLGYTVLLLGSSLGSVVITYLRIAMACLTSKNKVLNSKAMQTCATHLAIYIIMFVAGGINIFLARFPKLLDIRKVFAILFIVVPSTLNPLIYGLQIKAVREKIYLMSGRRDKSRQTS